MKNAIRFHSVFHFSLILLSLAIAFPAYAGRTVNEKCATSATGKIIIENVSGSVEVAGGNSSEVIVTGVLDDKVERLDFTCNNNLVKIKVILPEKKNRAGDADLRITVPAGSSVDINTVTANIHVDGIHGPLDLESVTGDIKAAGQTDSIDVRSVSGDVAILASSRNVEAQSVSSNISLRGVRNKVKASTTSGNIDVGDATVSAGDLHTISGDIRFEGSLVSGAQLNIGSMSGKVEAVFPRTISGEFNVSTFSGEISNDFGQTPQKKGRYSPGEKLVFSTGSDARISLESFSGEVFLKRK
jgi:DUF4097 and DUF4098 domain-containing protein YvlB